MKRFLFLLIAFLVAFSFGEESAPKQGRRGGFYFDGTVGAAVRHLEATRVQNNSSMGISGCHFELDGRYVCDDAKSTSSREESSVGYTGGGLFLSARFGGNFKGAFALFADVQFEETRGKTSGRKKGEDDAKPRSGNLLAGPGITIYPFFHRENSNLQNFYVSAIGDVGLGGGGGMGLFATCVTLEVGYLWPMSERFDMGVAMAGNILSTDSFDSKLEDEGGYGAWIGLKFVRK